MRFLSTSSSPWLLLVLLNSLLIQGATYIVRPMVTYRLVDLGAEASMVGVIGSMYALAPLLLAIQIGRWVDRGRAGSALFAGAVISTFGSIAILNSRDLVSLALAMPVLGLGHLLTMAGGQTLIAKLSADSDYEKNFGFLTFYASLGQAVGPFVGGYLADRGVEIDTTAPIALAIGLFLVASLAALPLARKSSNPQVGPSLGQWHELGALFKTPSFLSAIYVSGAITAVVDVFIIFTPLLGQEVGFGAFQIGLLLAIRSFAAMAIRLILGAATQRLGPRRLIILGSLVTAISCIAIAFVSDFALMSAVMVLAGLAMAIGQPASMAWVSRVTAPERRGLAISVRLTANRFGQVVVPIAAGFIATAGVGPVFLLLAAVQASSMAITARALPRRN